MENTHTKITLVSDDNGVSTKIVALVVGRNVLVKLHTSETVIDSEARYARCNARIACLIDFIMKLKTCTLNTTSNDENNYILNL